jgi:hypothetical protein
MTRLAVLQDRHRPWPVGRGEAHRSRPPAESVPNRSHGGFTFAEHPSRAAPEARIIWHADLDPGTIAVAASPADPTDPDSLDLDRIAPWLAVATDAAGREHAVLSDGWHHIRFDIEEGRLSGEQAVLLHFRLQGIMSSQRRLLPLRRFLDLCRRRQFARSLFPRDPQIARLIDMLRVHDALSQGASQRDIGAALFGDQRVALDWSDGSDSLRSRVRRLVREAGTMAQGGYRSMLHRVR